MLWLHATIKRIHHMGLTSILQDCYSKKYRAITAQKTVETVDLVTFTEEILNEKLHFSCSEFLG